MAQDRPCVVTSGGTFSMADTPRGLAPRPVADRVRRVLATRLPGCGEPRVIEVSPPVDSAEATPATWTAVLDAVRTGLGETDAVVVVHGTDTMAHTAAALAFALRGVPGRVVLTGAQRPLAHAGSDAADNLVLAVRTATTADPGVWIAFGGAVLPGVRAVKCSVDRDDAFRAQRPPSPRPDGARFVPRDFGGYRPDVEIPLVRLYPGISAATLGRVLDGAPGAVLECYGPGNAPVSTPGFLDALTAATARGCALVAVSRLPDGVIRPGAYAASAGLEAAGVVPGGSMTAEAALVKLHYLVSAGLGPADVRAALATDLAGEYGA